MIDPEINVDRFTLVEYALFDFLRAAASPRMTNWNNNGYILERARFEIHLLPRPETQSNRLGQEEDPTALPYLSS